MRPQWLEDMRRKEPEKAKMIELRMLKGSYNRLKRHKLIEKLSIEKKMGAMEIHHEMRRMVEAKLEGWEQCIADEGTLNVWSPSTIQGDLERMRKVWNVVVEKSVVNHRSALVQELESVKKKSWEDNNMKGVVSAIDRQIEILGLKQPERIEVKHGLMDEWAQKVEAAKRRLAEQDANAHSENTLHAKTVDAELVVEPVLVPATPAQ